MSLLEENSSITNPDENLTNDQTIGIGIVGGSRQGKSSLVNALLGFKFDEDGQLPIGAAPVDESNACNTVLRYYTYPNNSNIHLWDVPGNDVQMAEQLDKMRFEEIEYDFFLIVFKDVISTDVRFLLQTMDDKSKRFFLVRTHIDVTIEDAARIKKDEKTATDNTRESIQSDLVKIGYTTECFRNVYMIDNYSTEKFDFLRLQSDILKECRSKKKVASPPTPEASNSGVVDKIYAVLRAGVDDAARKCSLQLYRNEFELRVAKEVFCYMEEFRLSPETVCAAERHHRIGEGVLEAVVSKKIFQEGGLVHEIRQEFLQSSSSSQIQLLDQSLDSLDAFGSLPDAEQKLARLVQIGAISAFVPFSVFSGIGVISVSVTCAGVVGGAVYHTYANYKQAREILQASVDKLRRVAVETHEFIRSQRPSPEAATNQLIEPTETPQ